MMMRSRYNLNQRTATQPSNINGGTAYKISSWWRQQPRIAAATLKEAGSNTSTNNEDTTGRDDIETANSNNDKKNNPMRRKKPSMTPNHHHHHTCNSSNKQRVSSRHHRESSIATSILAGLILLFSIGMFLGSNLHIIMNLDTASESTDTAVNHLAYRNNPINTFAKEEITDDDQPKQSAEVEVSFHFSEKTP